jgi:NAD(P)H-nitrite reductase large subunit
MGVTASSTSRIQSSNPSRTLVGAEADLPTDRPNLSKDYLAGSAPEDWMALRGRAFYKENEITLRLATTAISIDRSARRVTLDDGSSLTYDALLLTPGAAPIRLPVEGGELPRSRLGVHDRLWIDRR